MSSSLEVALSSTPADAAAVETIRRHHAELAAGLSVRVEALLLAVDRGDHARIEPMRADVTAFCRVELLPHAEAEETTLYRRAAELPELRALVAVMGSEHVALRLLVDELAAAATPARAAAAARAIEALLQPHLAAENEILVPRLAAEPEVSLADLLERMHGDFTERQARSRSGDEPTGSAPGTARAGGCGCGGSDDAVPELDVRAIPHAIRHASVLGAFDAVLPGRSLILIAPHDPLPLLRQLTDRAGGRLDVEYLEQGPQAWKLKLTSTLGRPL
jgi:uncharacterized protein (DUF2249 family)